MALKSPTVALIADGCREMAKLKAIASEAVNAVNRQKTKVKNLFITLYRDAETPPGTIITVDGVDYTYGPSVSSDIDPRKWFDMWNNGQITNDQFFDALRVGKEDAKRIIGEDQCIPLLVDTIGKSSDVRSTVSDFEPKQKEKNGVYVRPYVPPKPVEEKPLQAPAKPAGRNIKLGSKVTK